MVHSTLEAFASTGDSLLEASSGDMGHWSVVLLVLDGCETVVQNVKVGTRTGL
jgi:hypothetical protein